CAPDAMKELVGAAGPLRLLARERRVGELERLHGDDRPIDARADLLTFAGALTRIERREDARGKRQGGVRVRDCGTSAEWRILFEPRLAHQTARCLRERVSARALLPWTRRSPRRTLRVDEARVSGRELLVRKAEPIEHPRAVVREEHVGTRQQPPEDLLPLFV